MQKLESKIQKEIMDALTAFGFFVYKVESGNKRGIPDINAIALGKSCYIEVKQPGKKPTPIQEEAIREIKQHGCIAFVTDSLRDCIEQLKQNGLNPYNVRL